MRQIKVFWNEQIGEEGEHVNDWLANVEGNIVDIKLSYSVTINGDGTCIMVIYEKPSKLHD